MWATGFGAGAAQAFAAEGLHTHHRADGVAVDVDVADVGGGGQAVGTAVDAGLDAHGQAVAQRVDLFDDGQRVARPAHHMEHRAEDFLGYVADLLQLESMRRYQVGSCLRRCILRQEHF